MEPEMTMEQVVSELRELNTNGESLSKKKVKQNHPELMKNALYYFPNPESLISGCTIWRVIHSVFLNKKK